MIQLILNNEVIKTSENPGVTLVDFIREKLMLKGTKIACREGDCGACTVLVGELVNGALHYKTITSCIAPLGNANGKHIVTIEGVNLKNRLNFVQQSILDNYATQCGFCTPGFVLSLIGYVLKKTSNNVVAKGEEYISGNICRCTGYKSIEKAIKSIDEKLIDFDGKDSINWLIKENFLPHYFEAIPNKLKQIEVNNLPKKGVVVGGGTDLYVVNADVLADKKINFIADYETLKGITFTDKKCIIGANTTVSEIAENERLQEFFPNFSKVVKLISSEQIRNMATVGGNFVNASPIGDMSIFFLALDCNLTIINAEGKERVIPFNTFYKDYKIYDLHKGELIQSISFNIPSKSTQFNFEKVSKRTHLDIASVNAFCKIVVENNIVLESVFTVGGVTEIPKYLNKTSNSLLGKELNVVNIIKAEQILQSEINPITDVRGSKEYKRLLAKQLFFAHCIKLFPNTFNILNFQKS